MTLDELKALDAVATPGPWRIPTGDDNTDDIVRGPGDFRIAGCCCCGGWTKDTDALLIAAARTMLPRLIAVAEAAKALGVVCTTPVYDTQGEGLWSTDVLHACGECPDCQLAEQLAAVEAAP